MKKVDQFLLSGFATCKHHGTHSEWRYLPRKEKDGKEYRALECRLCVRERTRRWNKRNPNYVDEYRYSVNGALRRMLGSARKRAREKNLPFEIDIEWVKIKLEEQNYTCPYTGVRFDLSPPRFPGEKRPWFPSIDQKVAGAGYTKENAQIVCSIVNFMKRDFSEEDFIKACRLVVARAST